MSLANLDIATSDPAALAQIADEYTLDSSRRSVSAAALSQPLRRQRDYVSKARKAMLEETIPDGALPYYDTDPEVGAYYISGNGGAVISQVNITRVAFKLFEIAVLVRHRYSEVRERRYDVPKRTQQKGVSLVNIAEDSRAFAIWDAIQTDGFGGFAPNPDFLVAAPLTPDILADGIGTIQSYGIKPARIFMNGLDYADLLKFGRDTVDPETQAVIWKTGLVAYVWGLQVITSRVVPRGVVYMTGEKELFGRVIDRTPLTVINADNPERLTLGYVLYEQLAIGCFNPYALCRFLITR